jgi:ATP-dependent RNA helicase DDX51/DBP6
MQVDEPVEQEQPRHRSPTPQAALPSFPRPVAPDAPSKSALALQGVDKALLGAEIIDPSHTLPLDAITRGPGELPVLSDRMRKRLTDLGITELFAGA